MASPTENPIVVVGAGIIGMSAAYHLLQSHQRDVIVVDAGDVGNGTTPAGAGFVGPWATVLPHLGAAGLELERYSLDFYRDIHMSGVEIAYRANGNIVFYNTSKSRKAGVDAILAGPCATPETRFVDAREVSELTSGAVNAAAIAGGVYMPGGIQIETGAALDELARRFERDGGRIIRRATVASVVTENSRVLGVELDSSVIDSDTVVLATGAWLNDLLEPAGWRLPLLPFVATRFVTEDVGVPASMPTLQGKDFPLWIRESEGGFTWGTTPGAAPAHRLSASAMAFDPHRRTRHDLIQTQHDDVKRIAEVFPALENATTVRELQGMPVYTVDGQFFVGPVPGRNGLWAVGGDNESGVSHGPGLGRLIADLIHGSEPLIDPRPYRLDRYDPAEYPDAESVGQTFVQRGAGFIAEAMRRPSRAV